MGDEVIFGSCHKGGGGGLHANIILLCTIIQAMIIIVYRMAGNFRGSQFSRFSRLTGDPRKLYPRNKKPKRTRARAITGGRGHRGACRAQLD